MKIKYTEKEKEFLYAQIFTICNIHKSSFDQMHIKEEYNIHKKFQEMSLNCE